MPTEKRKRRKRWIIILSGGLLFFIAVVVLLANFYVEPVLRNRLQTLIVEGSDSLYTYTVGDLHVNFFGGNVGVHDLHVTVDSNKFKRLKAARDVPPMVLELDVNNAHIKGIGIFSLVFGKKIIIDEISSQDANIRLSRYLNRNDTAVTTTEKMPVWKAIQPNIKEVAVNKIKLNGIKLLYKNEEGSEGKIQFDRCDAQFENIRIDSAAVLDTSRLGYVENFSFKLNDLKFRTTDSTYKLKAEWITYNSANRLLEVDSFKLQPTIKDPAERADSMRKSWYTVTFDKVSFMGLRLDRYLQLNRAEADSVLFQHPTLAVYQDKKGMKSYTSKIGKYPHQLLLNANSFIDIKKFIARDMQIAVTEKHETTREEGTITLSDIQLTVSNIVNDPVLINRNPVATAEASGKIIGSPIRASFRFYLDSAEGRFDAAGNISNVTAAQINPISTRLANIQVPSVQISSLQFSVRGEDYEATSDVQMVYNNLSLIFRKRDEETGAIATRTFLTKILNRYAINPDGNGNRKAENVRTARLTTQSFFGIIWKAVFEGMQRIMLKNA
jgi:hypothetical protein